ncbi:TIGR03086 family metal-binding protein [Kitasatospora sp. NPDC048540]|uniref:TIGR03086 family metal-binding protein n=1 Tax=unclassified Kitasatospora TaxID=2633591 RepID=UPI000690996B|nr:TIGR03086 family metal-binding protein [Kitasatospora sp. MBT63]
MACHHANGAHREVLERYTEAVEEFGRLVGMVLARQWGLPTPCTEWTVRDLVNHLTAEQLWVPEMLAGLTVSQVGPRYQGDVLGDDPAEAWDSAVRAATAAFTAPGALDRTVHLSYADRDALGYCREMAVDAVVHGWDLARALGGAGRMTPAAAGFVLAEVVAYGDLSSTGMFATAVPTGPDADPQTRLLGLAGRDPGWSPPG